MTPPVTLYEDFAGDADTQIRPISREAEIHAAAYAEGFEEGMAAARKAAEDDKGEEAAAFVQHLQDMAFSYHEATDHVLAELTPFLTALVGQLLPSFAKTALLAQIAALLDDEVQRFAGARLTLRVAEVQREAISSLLLDPDRCPVDLITAPDLTAGQAILGRDGTESLVDLDALCRRLEATVTGHLYELQRKSANG